MAALAILILIVLLNAADVATTVVGLRRGLDEANPLARPLFDAFGPLPAAIGIKLVLSAPMAALCLLYPRWWPVALLFAAALAWVVVHNLRELRSAGSGESGSGG